MAVALRQSKRFPASSPVTRYWLANCVGFSLAGGGRGRVERILADHDPYDPSVLEVRTGRRVRRVPTSAVIAVVPQDEVLVVDRRLLRMPNRKRHVNLRLRWTARVVQRVLVVGVGLLMALTAEAWLLSRRAWAGGWRLSRRAWVQGSPVVVRTSRKGSTEAVRLVR